MRLDYIVSPWVIGLLFGVLNLFSQLNTILMATAHKMFLMLIGCPELTDHLGSGSITIGVGLIVFEFVGEMAEF
jgi:hypothetical protein